MARHTRGYGRKRPESGEEEGDAAGQATVCAEMGVSSMEIGGSALLLERRRSTCFASHNKGQTDCIRMGVGPPIPGCRVSNCWESI